ncbi:MAG: DUF1844 domain-containing protein [Smithellaceae bacterium]|jgi:hypothetical protein
MKEKKKGPGFVVKDKRLFAESDEPRREEEVKASAAEEAPKPQEVPETPTNQEADYPPVNFTNFVFSLSTSALFHFGDLAESEDGKTQKNLPAAKQTIDILDMLNEKTKGNLDENENKLIQSVLYELKMRYVKEKA